MGKWLYEILELIKEYGFAGIDADWEYPSAADRGGTFGDKKNFLELVREMRYVFNTHNPEWEITVVESICMYVLETLKW